MARKTAKLGRWSAVALAAFVLVASGCGGSSGTPMLGTGTVIDGTGTGTTTTTAAAKLTLGISSTTVTAASPATLTVRVTDAAGTALSGQVVSFATGSNIAALSAPSALTNADGVATVNLTPASASTTGADAVTASVVVGTTTYKSNAVGFQLNATNIAIGSVASALGGSTLAAYGQTELSVALSGVSASTPASISLSSDCVTQGRAEVVPATKTTTTSPVSFTYRDKGCGSLGRSSDTLTIAVAGGASQTLQIPLVSPSVASMAFVSASPEVIYLAGSGSPQQTSTVTFQVLDDSGNPVPYRDVVLELVNAPEGVKLDNGTVAVTKRSDDNGKVPVTVASGTVPSPVRVKATLAGSTISTVSSNLTIGVGLPSQQGFSMAPRTLNIEGYNIDGTSNVFTVIASDRMGNPVPAGTAINFITEGGQVQTSALTAMAGGLSVATATFQTGQPRPEDGRVTVLAYALGEESFLDTNANNVYDAGEDYQDLGDVFLDRVFNGFYEASVDQVIGVSTRGTAACRTADSPLLQLSVHESSRPNTCVTGWGKAHVRRAAQIIFSTSTARPVLGERGQLLRSPKYPNGLTADQVAQVCGPFERLTPVGDARRSYTAASGEAPIKAWYVPAGGHALDALGSAGVIGMLAADANPVALNPMPAGTVISATGTDGLTVEISGGSPVASTASPTVFGVKYKFDTGVSQGTATINFRSPSGLITSIQQQLFRDVAPAAWLPCP